MRSGLAPDAAAASAPPALIARKKASAVRLAPGDGRENAIAGKTNGAAKGADTARMSIPAGRRQSAWAAKSPTALKSGPPAKSHEI